MFSEVLRTQNPQTFQVLGLDTLSTNIPLDFSGDPNKEPRVPSWEFSARCLGFLGEPSTNRWPATSFRNQAPSQNWKNLESDYVLWQTHTKVWVDLMVFKLVKEKLNNPRHQLGTWVTSRRCLRCHCGILGLDSVHDCRGYPILSKKSKKARLGTWVMMGF